MRTNETKDPIRTAIFASGEGSNFEAIVEANSVQKIGLEIVILVYNIADAGVVQRAKRLGVEAIFCTHKAYPTRRLFDESLSSLLVQHDIELILLAGWMRVFTKSFVDTHPSILNIHPSLLPCFKGLDAIQRSYEANARMGVTVHQVSEVVDGGPIILQSEIEREGLSLEDAKAKIRAEEHLIYPLAISSFIKTMK